MHKLILLSSLNEATAPVNPREYALRDVNRRLREIIGSDPVYTDRKLTGPTLHFQRTRYIPGLVENLERYGLRDNPWLPSDAYFYGSPALNELIAQACGLVHHVQIREIYPGTAFTPCLTRFVERYHSVHFDPEGFEYEYSELVPAPQTTPARTRLNKQTTDQTAPEASAHLTQTKF